MTCTRCEGTGFLNLHQLDGAYDTMKDPIKEVQEWMKEQTEPHNVQICDCCGDGSGWYGEPGEHYGRDDPQGPRGPYANNGGLCECH